MKIIVGDKRRENADAIAKILNEARVAYILHRSMTVSISMQKLYKILYKIYDIHLCNSNVEICSGLQKNIQKQPQII